MSCKCGSSRIAEINAKCKHGYVPHDMGIGGGDYIRFEYCLDCGVMIGNFPLPKTEIETTTDENE